LGSSSRADAVARCPNQAGPSGPHLDYHPQHLRSLLDRERGRNAGRAAPPDRVHRGTTLPPRAEGHPARGEEGPLTIIRYTLKVHTLPCEEWSCPVRVAA